MIHDDDPPASSRSCTAPRLPPPPSPVEYRIVRADGNVRWVTSRGKVFYDGDGKPIRVIGAVMDITASSTPKSACTRS